MRPVDVPMARSLVLDGVKRQLDFITLLNLLPPEKKLKRESDLHAANRGRSQRLLTRLVERIPSLPMLIIDDSAMDVLDDAWQSVPPDAHLRPEFMFSDSGLVFFGRPFTFENRPDDSPFREPAAGTMWHRVDDGMLFSFIRHDEEGWSHMFGTLWTIGTPVDHPQTPGSIADAERQLMQQDDRRFFLALHLLLTQGGVLETADVPLDRATRRRETREGRPEPKVRVIYLRGSDSHGSFNTGRHLSKRFVVRGHWRNQAYGPRQSLRRPTWIAPHVKGPDGAPLDKRPTVYALTTAPRTEAAS